MIDSPVPPPAHPPARPAPAVTAPRQRGCPPAGITVQGARQLLWVVLHTDAWLMVSPANGEPYPAPLGLFPQRATHGGAIHHVHGQSNSLVAPDNAVPGATAAPDRLSCPDASTHTRTRARLLPFWHQQLAHVCSVPHAPAWPSLC